MFSTFKPSDLTKEDCDLLTTYLNAKYNPFPDIKKFHWKSATVSQADANYLQILAGSPIVCYEGPNGFRDHDGTPPSLKALSELRSITEEYFKTNFRGQHFFQDDQYCYYITDLKLLEKLKIKALEFQLENKSGLTMN
jgi:hypothetical protein